MKTRDDSENHLTLIITSSKKYFFKMIPQHYDYFFINSYLSKQCLHVSIGLNFIQNQFHII
jgi:hypothetical protein